MKNLVKSLIPNVFSVNASKERILELSKENSMICILYELNFKIIESEKETLKFDKKKKSIKNFQKELL